MFTSASLFCGWYSNLSAGFPVRHLHLFPCLRELLLSSAASSHILKRFIEEYNVHRCDSVVCVCYVAFDWLGTTLGYTPPLARSQMGSSKPAEHWSWIKVNISSLNCNTGEWIRFQGYYLRHTTQTYTINGIWVQTLNEKLLFMSFMKKSRYQSSVKYARLQVTADKK